VGDYVYTFKDERKMTEFPDAVAMEKGILMCTISKT